MWEGFAMCLLQLLAIFAVNGYIYCAKNHFIENFWLCNSDYHLESEFRTLFLNRPHEQKKIIFSTLYLSKIHNIKIEYPVPALYIRCFLLVDFAWKMDFSLFHISFPSIRIIVFMFPLSKKGFRTMLISTPYKPRDWEKKNLKRKTQIEIENEPKKKCIIPIGFSIFRCREKKKRFYQNSMKIFYQILFVTWKVVVCR